MRRFESSCEIYINVHHACFFFSEVVKTLLARVISAFHVPLRSSGDSGLRRWRQIQSSVLRGPGQKPCENPSYKGLGSLDRWGRGGVSRLRYHLVWLDRLRQRRMARYGIEYIWSLDCSLYKYGCLMWYVCCSVKEILQTFRDSYIYINIDVRSGRSLCRGWEGWIPVLICHFWTSGMEMLADPQSQENDLDCLPSRYSDFTPYHLYSRL